MTKSQIKAELRRSAIEYDDPWLNVNRFALLVAAAFCKKSEQLGSLEYSDCGTFFLLISEAL